VWFRERLRSFAVRVRVFGSLALCACGGVSRDGHEPSAAGTSADGGTAGAAGGTASAAGGIASAAGGTASAAGGTASAAGGIASAAGGIASATGGIASAGAAAVGAGGSNGEPAPDSPLAGVKLDDDFPWFYVAGNAAGAGSLLPPEPDASSNPVLHLVLQGEPARATLSTHNHFEVIRFTERVEFSAKATELLALRVSARQTLEGSDYFGALEAGYPWPTAEVQVTTGWQRFSIPLTEMRPPEPNTEPSTPRGSFSVAFIVAHPRAVELWLDEVRFE
jgi:hypothetical protein